MQQVIDGQPRIGTKNALGRQIRHAQALTPRQAVPGRHDDANRQGNHGQPVKPTGFMRGIERNTQITRTILNGGQYLLRSQHLDINIHIRRAGPEL